MDYFQINEAQEPDGRRRFRASLHEIYPDNTHWNLNGICYLKEFTQKNMQSAIGSPICCEFAGEDKSAPLGHGYTGQREDDGLSLFEKSVVVGVIDGVSIEDITIDGEQKTVLMSTGVLYEQRYPELIEWIQMRLASNMKISGSVEFVGTSENNGLIKYLNDYDGEGRIPVEYKYSGYCILSVPPADNAAVVLELNQKEGVNIMDEAIRTEICSVINSTITEAFANAASAGAQIEEYKAQLNERDTKINELNAQISELNEKLAQKDAEIEECKKKAKEQCDAVQGSIDELNSIKVEAAKAQLNEKLNGFTEKQRKVAETEINAFMAAPLENINSIDAIADKIAAAAYREAISDKNKNHETNAWNLSGLLSGIDPITPTDNNSSNYDPAADFGI